MRTPGRDRSNSNRVPNDRPGARTPLAREEGDPWDDVLAETIGTIEQGEERVATADLLGLVLGIHVSKQRDLDYKRLSRCMRRLGWDGPKSTRIAGKVTKGYTRPIGTYRRGIRLIQCPQCGYKGEGWLDGAQTTCMAIKPFPPCKCTYVIEMQDGHWNLIGTYPAGS